MAGALDHLGGQDADGAVVSGEGLIQLGHAPANGRCLLHQMNLKAQVSQVNGGLDASDPPADD